MSHSLVLLLSDIERQSPTRCDHYWPPIGSQHPMSTTPDHTIATTSFGIKSTICGHESSREMPGIECSRFVSLTDFLAKHLKCCICLNVFDRAVTNDCGHTYCKHCIGDWIASDRHDCPECRRPLATRKRSQELATSSAAANDTQTLFIARGFVLEYNLKINSMIGEMHIKCRHESTGC
ncbi:unnamed protein product, partial [Medioppia subpectinata]